MMVWFLIGLMACVTYANRLVFLLETIKTTPNERFNVFLSYSSYAVLTAIWAPIVLQLDLDKGFELAGNDYVIAASVAAHLTVFRLPSIVVVLTSIGLFGAIRFLL